MKLCPKLGQQVLIEYLDIYLVPVTFVGWCIFNQKDIFTLTDGYSRRQFMVSSPMVLSISLTFSSNYSFKFKRKNRKKYYEHKTISIKLLNIINFYKLYLY